MLKLIKPKNGETVSQLRDYQISFLANCEEYANDSRWRRHFGWVEECSIPAFVHFAWESEEEETFLLSDTPDFSHIVACRSAVGSCDVCNLMIGRTYYWRVGDSEIRCFETEQRPPRLLYVPGMANIRDIGGWMTLEGKRIKQGKIYRSPATTNEFYQATDEGIRVLHDDFGIRCDFDLRGNCDNGHSPIGEDVSYCFYSAKQYEDFVLDRERNVQMFRRLLDETIYPVFIHCAYGLDRTGSLIAMLMGVLGADDETIICDYEIGALVASVHSRHSDDWTRFVAALQEYGNTLSEQFCGYLKSGGITDEELDQFRQIMLEDC